MGSGRGPGRNGGPMMHGPRGSAPSAPPLIEVNLSNGRAPPWTTAALPDLRADAAAADPAISLRSV